MPAFREVANGLGFVEGPVWTKSGSIYVVDIHSTNITLVSPDGHKEVLARAGGGPNGLAVGPDDKLYVCNNGGFEWHKVNGSWFPSGISRDYLGGSIQRLDPSTGHLETLYRSCGDVLLRGPNDIVFDTAGGFWFTDLGKQVGRSRDLSAIYYATPDGRTIEQACFPLDGANGIALSTDGSRLYTAETFTGRVYFWELNGPGQIKANPRSANGGYYLGTVQGGLPLDSMAVDSEDNICIAAPGKGGGIVIFGPDGNQEMVPTGDPLTTNICFGGPGLLTAFITLSFTGRLVACDWPVAGHDLAYLI